MISILVATSSDNSIHAIPISYDPDSENIKEIHMPTLIHAPSRFHVQAKEIYLHTPMSTLIYVFSMGLSIKIVSINLKNVNNFNDLSVHLSKDSLPKLLQPIHTLTILEKSETELHIACFSDYRNALLLGAIIGEKSISLAAAETNPLQKFIDDRVAAGEFLGSNYTQDAMTNRRYMFQCFGVTASPLGDYIAFLHSIIPDTQLRYPIPSSVRARISFMVLSSGNSSSNSTTHIPRLQPESIAVAMPATLYSPMVTWWKVQAVIGSLRQKLRPAFIEAVSKLFHDHGIICEKQGLVSSASKNIDDTISNCRSSNKDKNTLAQTIGFDLFSAVPELDNYRAHHHYNSKSASYPRAFVERLAYSVLAFLAVTDVDDYGSELVGLDKALVLAYARVMVLSPKHGNRSEVQTVVARVFAKYGLLTSESDPIESVSAESTTLAVKGDGFEETFNFFKLNGSCNKHDSDNNHNANIDLYSIVSEGRHHSWRVCATTLLPLLQYDGKTCTGCGRPQIVRDESDPVYGGIILKSVLEAIDICIYCGCKFVNN